MFTYKPTLNKASCIFYLKQNGTCLHLVCILFLEKYLQIQSNTHKSYHFTKKGKAQLDINWLRSLDRMFFTPVVWPTVGRQLWENWPIVKLVRHKHQWMNGKPVKLIYSHIDRHSQGMCFKESCCHLLCKHPGLRQRNPGTLQCSDTNQLAHWHNKGGLVKPACQLVNSS